MCLSVHACVCVSLVTILHIHEAYPVTNYFLVPMQAVWGICHSLSMPTNITLPSHDASKHPQQPSTQGYPSPSSSSIPTIPFHSSSLPTPIHSLLLIPTPHPSPLSSSHPFPLLTPSPSPTPTPLISSPLPTPPPSLTSRVNQQASISPSVNGIVPNHRV